jgi:hypothetical protein
VNDGPQPHALIGGPTAQRVTGVITERTLHAGDRLLRCQITLGHLGGRGLVVETLHDEEWLTLIEAKPGAMLIDGKPL